MMDELTGNGGSIDTDKLSQQLGVPVVPICAASGDGVEALIEAAVRTAEDKRLPAVVDFCAPGPVHRCIHAVCHQIEDHAQRAGFPSASRRRGSSTAMKPCWSSCASIRMKRS